MRGSDNKGDGLASQPRRYWVPGQPLLNWHQVLGASRSPDGVFAQQEQEPTRGRPARGHTVDGRDNAWRSRAPGPHAHGNTARQVMDGLWTERVDSKHSQTTPATTSTTSIRQLLGAADTQTAQHATSSTAPAHQPLGSANTETTLARAPAAAADRKKQPGATCERKHG